MTGCVARCKQTANFQRSNVNDVVLSNFIGQRSDSIVTAIDFQSGIKLFHQLFIAASVVPVMVAVEKWGLGEKKIVWRGLLSK